MQQLWRSFPTLMFFWFRDHEDWWPFHPGWAVLLEDIPFLKVNSPKSTIGIVFWEKGSGRISFQPLALSMDLSILWCVCISGEGTSWADVLRSLILPPLCTSMQGNYYCKNKVVHQGIWPLIRPLIFTTLFYPLGLVGRATVVSSLSYCV